MLSAAYLDSISNKIDLAAIEEDILKDMARRIDQYDYFIPAAQHQRQMLQVMGLERRGIIDLLSKYSSKSAKEIDQMLIDAGRETLKYDDAIYREIGLNPAPVGQSAKLNEILNAAARQTRKQFANLTRTTAVTAGNQFGQALDSAWYQVFTGGMDKEAAIRSAVKSLSAQGVGAVTYGSRVDTIDVAFRRAISTGINQASSEMQLARAEELGWDLVETSAHGGARLSHALWQGQVFSLSGNTPGYRDFRAATGYGNVDGLCGANCRHSFSPFHPAMGKTWTANKLAALDDKKFTYQGKKLTETEARTVQRKNERQIRRWKRENSALREIGEDTTESTAKIQQWQRTQANFLRQTGLKRQPGREA